MATASARRSLTPPEAYSNGLLSDAVPSRAAGSSSETSKVFTIENRAAHLQSIPDDVLAEIKECDVTLKGPTTTPEKGDGWPNLESANVGMRKELDLFANVRPVRVPSEGIDWVFFRENTEDLYALGSDGIDVTDDFTIDFRLISEPGSERIIRAAFEHAKQNGRDRVTVVTKANIVKLSDGTLPAGRRTRFTENTPASSGTAGTSTS